MVNLIEELCKGPVVVIDDQVEHEQNIKRLVREIEDKNLPVLTYDSIEEARNKLQRLMFSNFIILDWRMIEGAETVTEGVQIGAEAVATAEVEVIEFIKELKRICLAPIFIFSAFNKDEIISRLKAENIITEDRNYVFVETKQALCQRKGRVFSKINKWIKDSPHIYLSKCWTNEWIAKNNMVFWELYELNPDWPSVFYKSFKDDGEDPILALRDTLFNLIFSEIDVSGIDTSLVSKKPRTINLESLKRLYKRLVYIDNEDIRKNIRPGDIYKREEEQRVRYYLNIRPECDTVKRKEDDDPCLYLLEGHSVKQRDIKDRFKGKYGIVPWENEIIMLNLDGNDIVQFLKKNLIVKLCSEMTDDYTKICRVVPPFISQIRQSYTSYLSRFGIPSYPKTIK